MTPSTVRICTNSRLAFGLIDMNGEIGRVEGGLGLVIEHPRVVLSARRADAVTIKDLAGISRGVQRKFESMAAAFREHHGTQGIEATIEETIPDHSGLGSGTQLAMAFGQAFNLLYDLKLTGHEIGRIAGRGGTSGIGCAAFEMGGFLADGGHRFRRPGGKTEFAPSAASTEFSAPPILFHSALPKSWSVILAIPAQGRQTHGDEEREVFHTACPVPAEEAAQAARLALLKVLPAVMEADLEGFGDGLEAMQRHGFKRVQFARQSEIVHLGVAEMRRLGLKGVGMSSWGPTLFGFSEAGPEADQKIVRDLEAFGATRGGIRVILTKPAEHGTTWSWE
jgi:beta-ribofuranosylaminobenzene 5'-phosphate synthase